MNTYKLSDGSRLKKSIIDRKIAKAKIRYKEIFIDEKGYPFCERTKRSNTPLECSHIVSVKKCQEIGKSELAWSLDNLELLTRREHMKVESMSARNRMLWFTMRKNGSSWTEFQNQITSKLCRV